MPNKNIGNRVNLWYMHTYIFTEELEIYYISTDQEKGSYNLSTMRVYKGNGKGKAN